MQHWDVLRRIYRLRPCRRPPLLKASVEAGGDRRGVAVNGAWEIPRTIYKERNDSFPEREGLEPNYKRGCVTKPWRVTRLAKHV